MPVEISRTGYTGDLGYEIWVPAQDAIKVWDTLIDRGRPFDIKPTGMLALDVARIEAGLLLIDIDFNSSKKSLIESQKYSPFEMGLGRLVNLDKPKFVGKPALIAEQKRGAPRQIVGLDINWPDVETDLRGCGAAAGGVTDCFARRSSRLQQRHATRESYLNHVVADFEEDDCAGDVEERLCQTRLESGNRDHGRSHASSRRRDRGKDAVL